MEMQRDSLSPFTPLAFHVAPLAFLVQTVEALSLKRIGERIPHFDRFVDEMDFYLQGISRLQ
jgi:hypothetical protein